MILILRTDFLIIVAGRLATALLGLLSLRAMTLLLHPVEYGQWSLLIAFQMFCGLFLINPVGMYINRHTHEWWDSSELMYKLKQYNRYIVLVSFFIWTVVFSWWQLTQSAQHSGYVAAVGIALLVYASTWNATLLPMLNMLGFRAQSAIWLTITALCGLVFSITFVSVDHSGIAWIFGQAFGQLIGAYAGWRILKRNYFSPDMLVASLTLRGFLSKETVLKFCLPLAIATGCMWLQTTSYRFFVGPAWGLVDLALLVVGLGISTQLWAVAETLAMQFLSPYFYKSISTGNDDGNSAQSLSDLLNILIPLYAIFAAFNILSASALLYILTDQRYHLALPFVIYGALIEFARSSTNIWSNAAQVRKDTKTVILPYAIGAAVVWLGALLLHRWNTPIENFSYVLVLAGVIACITMVGLMKRLLPLKLELRRVLLPLFILMVSLVSVVLHPIQVQNFSQSIGLLIITGSLSIIFMLAITWNNPALKRLLSTRIMASK